MATTTASRRSSETFLPATARPIPHLAGEDIEHPEIEAVRARRAEFPKIGYKGAEDHEEPTDIPATVTQSD